MAKLCASVDNITIIALSPPIFYFYLISGENKCLFRNWGGIVG